MIDEHANPPRLALLLLQTALSTRDAEWIVGDLIEEYRVVRRPRLGRTRADLWFARHVVSVVVRPMWPFAGALAVAKSSLVMLALFPLSGPWNPSLVPAPNVSLLDAILFLLVGYSSARRTGRVATGVVNGGILGLIDFAVFGLHVMPVFPAAITAAWQKPFILAIGCTFLGLAMSFALSLAAVGAACGRWGHDERVAHRPV